MPILKEPPPTTPEWVLSYGDLMSLLLTLFVMIVSLSELKSGTRFQSVASALERKFGHAPAEETLPPEERKLTSDELLPNDLAGAKTETLGEPTGERERLVSVAEFEPQSPALSAEAARELRLAFASVMANPPAIEIRGLAAGAPVLRSEFRDPHDLAYERARAVARYLTEELRIDRQRIRLSSWSTREVVADRVEVFMADQASELPPVATATRLQSNSGNR